MQNVWSTTSQTAGWTLNVISTERSNSGPKVTLQDSQVAWFRSSASFGKRFLPAPRQLGHRRSHDNDKTPAFVARNRLSSVSRSGAFHSFAKANGRILSRLGAGAVKMNRISQSENSAPVCSFKRS